MRYAFIAILCLPLFSMAQTNRTTRYGVLFNPDTYSQKTPKDTLESVLTAMENKRLDYLAAQLMLPTFVDARLQETYASYEEIAYQQLGEAAQRGNAEERLRRVSLLTNSLNFQGLTEAIRLKFVDEPDTFTQLQKFESGGTFNEAGETATITHPDIPGRTVNFRKIDNRWYIDNQRDPVKE
ncbi:MAG: hypothetical protein R3B84_00650 [Zavarzinella sp.]